MFSLCMNALLANVCAKSIQKLTMIRYCDLDLNFFNKSYIVRHCLTIHNLIFLTPSLPSIVTLLL